MNPRRILYLSQATAPLSRPELLALHYASQTSNLQRGVTGLMLYSGGNFMQVLEGRPDQVGDLMRIIERDPRHMNIKMLIDEIVPERLFSAWAMGLLDISRLRPVDTDRLSMVMRAIYQEVKSTESDLEKASSDGHAALKHGRAALSLLRDFSQQLAA
jgi:hypothetical protein